MVPPAPRSRTRKTSSSKSISDLAFWLTLGVLGGSYVLLILLLLVADAAFVDWRNFTDVLSQPEIRSAVWRTLLTCTVSALLSMWVAVPLGYVMSRHRFWGHSIVDLLIEVPVVLPPLIIGLSLLILFHIPILDTTLDQVLRERFRVQIPFAVPAVILAQFSVAAAFAIRVMRVTFDEISPRAEQVAWTLGCGSARAFLEVALPQARRGLISAFALAWARSLGEFGPILVFAGATRMRTEVLSTTVFLELSVGNLNAAVTVSILMVVAAFLVLGGIRWLGLRNVT